MDEEREMRIVILTTLMDITAQLATTEDIMKSHVRHVVEKEEQENEIYCERCEDTPDILTFCELCKKGYCRYCDALDGHSGEHFITTCDICHKLSCDSCVYDGEMAEPLWTCVECVETAIHLLFSNRNTK